MAIFVDEELIYSFDEWGNARREWMQEQLRLRDVARLREELKKKMRELREQLEKAA